MTSRESTLYVTGALILPEVRRLVLIVVLKENKIGELDALGSPLASRFTISIKRIAETFIARKNVFLQ